MNSLFTHTLLEWNAIYNKREMPWKGEKDPYRIWLSEIILQQTRVEQGLAYYNRFIHQFPTVHDLANAPEQEVFKLWEGLGYYSRCKNLIKTARFISTELNGKFPERYEDILALSGIGPYTAAAISSFAFNLPHAVVDGNVLRVLSRYFGISTPIDSTEGKHQFTKLAGDLLDRNQPAAFNQAIMDFGAVVCKAQLPLCETCMERPGCKAYQNNLVRLLPVKSKSLVKKTRWFYYFVVQHDGKYYIRKRIENDIWQNLYEFVLKESDIQLFPEEAIAPAIIQNIIGQDKFSVSKVSAVYKQQLTHQTIIGQFITLNIDKPSSVLLDYQTVSEEELFTYPFPKIISNWLVKTAAN